MDKQNARTMPGHPATADQPILEFSGACIPIEPDGGPSPPIDMLLSAGSLALVGAGDVQQASALADAAVGLTPLAAGHVRFLGRDWSKLPHVHAQAMRGRIGHVFAAGNWIDGLSLLDNILLPQLYHTRRPLPDLRAEAARVATMFGLPGVPTGDPADHSPGDLQRAACVRAFLGRPKLIILEHPTQDVFPAIIEPLVNAIRTERDLDASVLWLTLEPEVWSDPSVPADARYRFRNGALQTIARAA
jgi:phospholipid/cholesterol/gamma-HCH transport system ATP-binding protein